MTLSKESMHWICSFTWAVQVRNLDMYMRSKCTHFYPLISVFSFDWDQNSKKKKCKTIRLRNLFFVFFFFSGWKVEFGGFTSYIAHDEDEEVSDVMFSLE